MLSNSARIQLLSNNMFTFFKNKKWGGVLSKKTPVFYIKFFVLVIVTLTVLFPANTQASVASDIFEYATGVNSFADVTAMLMEAFLSLAALVLYAAGSLLTAIIDLSVNNMGSIVNSVGVRAAWSTFRDIANMSFIFIILYIAINTILGTGNINMKKMLVRIVVIAVLLNFSFFFTKVAVDASNILTLSFHNQIIKTPCGAEGAVAGNLGQAFMCQMGLPSFYKADSVRQLAGESGGLGTGAVFTRGIMGSIFFLITAFIFLAAAIMFIARFIAFIFLFMLSPLAFASMALPSDKYSDMWKKSLLENCLFAPAFMLTIWASLKVLGGITQSINPSGNLNLAGAINGGTGAGAAFLNYAIVIGMIIGSLLVAKKFGAYGAGGALKMLGGAGNWTQGKLGRGALRFGYGKLSVAGADKALADSEFGKSWAGRALRGATTGLATGYKFADKKSIQSVNKDRKKVQEDLAKDVIRDTENALDKSLGPKRSEEIKILTGDQKTKRGLFPKIDNETEAKKLAKEIEEDKKTYKEYTRTTGKDIGLEQKNSLKEKEARLEKLTKEKESFEEEDSKLSQTIKSLEERIKSNPVASKEEKAKWLPDIQRKKMEEMSGTKWTNPLNYLPSYNADRKKVANELKKVLRGGGQKGIKETLEELQEQTGEKPPEDAGGNKGGEKKT